MMRTKMMTGALLLAALGSASVAGAQCNGVANNLVKNCGFESGDFTSWTGSATVGTDYSYVGPIDGVNQSAPYEGSFEAFLGTEGANGTLTQMIATSIGTKYQIEFALANDLSSGPGYLNKLLVSFGDASLFSESNVTESGFTLYSLTAIATASSSALTFTERNDSGYFDLDSISVAASSAPSSVTPEPSSLLLLGTGLLGAVGMVRRRLSA